MNIAIEQLAEAVAERIQPAIPLSVALWNYKTIAAYLNRATSYVENIYAPMPGFPQPIRLPSTGKGKGKPLFKAVEIIEWAERYQEKRVA